MTINDVTTDLATDYDIFGEQFVRDPYSVYDELRGTCPIAHSDRHGGSWLPTTYQDIYDIAHDVDHFSSRQVSLLPPPERAAPDAYVQAGVPADLLGPAGAPLGPPADPAAVRPEGRAAVRRRHARAVPHAHRRLHRPGSRRCGHRLRPADPGAGHRHDARCRDRPLRRVRRLGASGPRERPVRPGGSRPRPGRS